MLSVDLRFVTSVSVAYVLSILPVKLSIESSLSILEPDMVSSEPNLLFCDVFVESLDDV